MLVLLLQLVIAAIVIGLVLWLIGQIPGTEPFRHILYVVCVVVFIVYIIYVLMNLMGGVGMPHLSR